MNYFKTKIACSFIGMAGFLYWQNNGLMLTPKTHCKNVPQGFDGYKILQVSDLQNKAFGKNQEKLLRKITNATPDIIVITGDLIDRNRTNLNLAMDFVDNAVHIAPVYYVSGNHEHQSGYFDELIERLTNAGVTVLENGKSIIERNGDAIELIGLADKRVNPYYEQVLSTLLKGCHEGRFQILLCHRPELFQTYVKKRVEPCFYRPCPWGTNSSPLDRWHFCSKPRFFPHLYFWDL